ncbi:MAG: ATP-binding protein, partial [Myxococcota bacterium]
VWVRLVVRALKYKGQALVQLNLKDLTEEVEDREHFERMAHVVIHDLKQPLRALLSLPGILQSDCGEALEPSGVELLTRITAAARRLHKQINGLSAYALEYERPLVFGSVSLNSIVHDVVACRIGKLRMADIDVDVGELPSVWGDQTGLRAVIEHLFDHMLGMSSILERRVLKIRWISQGHGRFEISDSSVVIETRHLANIFEVFGMRTDDGSGVRLALCKRVIERHGGEIGARNASDLGAVFWFTLPSIKHGS